MLLRPVRAHGLAGVHDEVEQHLLQFDPVAQHGGELRGRLRYDLDVARDQIAVRQLQHFAHELVGVQRLELRFAFFEQSAQPADDFSGAPVLGDDVAEYLAQLLGVDTALLEIVLGSLRIAQNGGERLVELVGERPGKLADQGHAGQMGDLLLLVPCFAFGALFLGDVANGFDETGHAADFDDFSGDHCVVHPSRPVPQVHFEIPDIPLGRRQVVVGLTILGTGVHLEFRRRASHRLRAGIAEHGLPSDVDVDDRAVRAPHDRHRVGAGAERLGEALFGHLQCFLRLAPFFHGRGEKQQGHACDDHEELNRARVPLLLLAAAVEERRKTKEALQVSEERFAKAFRSSPDPMAIMRRSDSSIIDVNVRWESMFGYSRAQAVGRTTAELEVYANPKDRQTYDDLAAAQGYVRDFEVDLRDRTGRVHHAVIAAEIVEVGGVPCFIETIRDVTEKKRAEREAQDQQKQITHLTRVALIGELSGALAHELNQPLTAILSNAQAAQHYLEKGRIDPKELREILGDIVAQDRRAGEVIRRLRALFKKGETQFQALDANELVREVLELAHSDLITRNIEVVTQASPQLPAMLGDRVELQQVLLNLIVNACEAMSADGPKEHALTIRTESAADGVQLSVIDHGPGIPADMQERLFEPFFTTKPQGLGLGLSISRSIITAHRGRIWGTNNPDRGATFHIVLPVHAEGTS